MAIAGAVVGLGVAAVVATTGRDTARAGPGRALGASGYAKRLDASDGGPVDVLAFELVYAAALRRGDLILCTPGDVIAATGRVIGGDAAVVTPAVPPRPVPVVRASARRRGVVVGGTRVLSGHVIVRLGDRALPGVLDDVLAPAGEPRTAGRWRA